MLANLKDLYRVAVCYLENGLDSTITIDGFVAYILPTGKYVFVENPDGKSFWAIDPKAKKIYEANHDFRIVKEISLDDETISNITNGFYTWFMVYKPANEYQALYG